MDRKKLLLAWCASTHVKHGPVSKKDKAALKWLGIVLGAVVLISLVFLLMYNA